MVSYPSGSVAERASCRSSQTSVGESAPVLSITNEQYVERPLAEGVGIHVVACPRRHVAAADLPVVRLIRGQPALL